MSSSTVLITHPDCLGHETPQGHPEQIARLEVLLKALERLPVEVLSAPLAQEADLLSVHPQHYLEALRAASPAHGSAALDADTHLSAGSLKAAYRAAGGVLLAVDQVLSEAKHLHSQGFRSILLVAGEHPKFVSSGYIEECIFAIKDLFPSIALEIAPMKEPEYISLVNAGCEALVVYQETYNRKSYKNLHTSGPKKNFNWRLECPERAYNAGFRRIGIGALFGLSEWKKEALSLAAHLDYLQRVCWKANYTVSFPRIRPAAGQFNPEHSLNDRDFVQLVCAFRICFPDVGIVLSTREKEIFRNNLVNIGITTISAGSHTEPGGYTGEGKDDLHYTVGGRRIEINEASEMNPCSSQTATEQFEINDERSPAEVCKMLKSKGLDPVWKDWDTAILSS